MSTRLVFTVDSHEEAAEQRALLAYTSMEIETLLLGKLLVLIQCRGLTHIVCVYFH